MSQLRVVILSLAHDSFVVYFYSAKHVFFLQFMQSSEADTSLVTKYFKKKGHSARSEHP